MEIKATTANGYSSNMSFALSLYAEDYSRDPVKLTNTHTVVTTGPFSRVPIKVSMVVCLSAHINPKYYVVVCDLRWLPKLLAQNCLLQMEKSQLGD